MTWLYEGIEYTEPKDFLGFVYQITNLINGRRYIGKKTFYFTKTKTLKGKKKKVKSESDWKKYYGSNAALKEDVKKYGKENFRREILKLCMTKGDSSYNEAKYQFINGVLEGDGFYNDWISVKVARSHLSKT